MSNLTISCGNVREESEIKPKSLAVPKVEKDPVEEKENIEVSRKKTSFKVPVQTPRPSSVGSSSHTPRGAAPQQQQTTTRQTKTVQIRGKAYQILDKLGRERDIAFETCTQSMVVLERVAERMLQPWWDGKS